MEIMESKTFQNSLGIKYLMGVQAGAERILHVLIRQSMHSPSKLSGDFLCPNLLIC